MVLAHGAAHILRDGGIRRPAPATERKNLNLTVSENAGTGDRLEMLCGRFILTAPHDRLVHAYLPARLIVRAGGPGMAGRQRIAQSLDIHRVRGRIGRLSIRGRLHARFQGTCRHDARGLAAHGAGAGAGIGRYAVMTALQYFL